VLRFDFFSLSAFKRALIRPTCVGSARVRPALAMPALTVVMALGVSACSSPPAHNAPGEPWDPYETRNRDIHEFNKDVDRYAFRPIAKGYSAAMPDDVETFFSRLAKTLSLPGSVVNSLLQGDVVGAGTDTARFAVNATFGLGGVFDAATEMGMPPARDADFGQTLHVWDVPQGGYVELPLLGPSTERDTVGTLVDFFTNPLDHVLGDPEVYAKPTANTSNALSQRGGPFGATIDSVLYESADSYAQSRSIYLQNRRAKLGGSDFGDPYDDPYGPIGQ
jgi:phospholipid-binding lipoprotein MlaA